MAETFRYTPQGVCSRQYIITVEGRTLLNVEIEGGCSGNLQGLSGLLKGMDIEDAISRLEGIRCGERDTSCPDQISLALKEALKARPDCNR